MKGPRKSIEPERVAKTPIAVNRLNEKRHKSAIRSSTYSISDGPTIVKLMSNNKTASFD